MIDVLVAAGRWASVLAVCALCATFSAIGLAPCWYLFHLVSEQWGDFAAFLSVPFLYFVWGTVYMACCVVFKLLLWYHPREGGWPLFTWPSVGWGLTGATINFGSHFFLKHFKGTPALNLFFKLLGAKIGRRVSINTVEIYDWNLITIGDDAVIGGDACLMAHSLEAGRMQMKPIVIGKKAMVGGNAKVMPGCVIEDGGILGASSLMTKGTRIPANEMWGGMPARFIKERKSSSSSSSSSKAAEAPAA